MVTQHRLPTEANGDKKWRTRSRAIWDQGKAVINGWLAIPSGFSAEMMAQCGFDSVTVDLQHGVQDYLSMVQCFQAMQAHPVTPMVRVPWNEPGIIGKVLDAGAQGVICPMVNTREEAEAFVAACKYPPRGTRSNGPVRAGLYGEPGTYQKTANTETLCIPMIETQSAVKNLEAILDVEGVAGVYIGPSDLGLSYGLRAEIRPAGAGDACDLRPGDRRMRQAQGLCRHPHRRRRRCRKMHRARLPPRDADQ